MTDCGSDLYNQIPKNPSPKKIEIPPEQLAIDEWTWNLPAVSGP